MEVQSEIPRVTVLFLLVPKKGPLPEKGGGGLKWGP